MHLAAMMRLVVKEMKDSDWCWFQAILALAIGVAKWSGEKIVIHFFEEGFDARVLFARAELSSAKVSNRMEFSGGVVLPPPANLDIQIRSPSRIWFSRA
jgi:hypothetical protein